MEAATIRTLHALDERAAKPASQAPSMDDWDWVYEDPDLAPFAKRAGARKEVPLTAWA